MVSLKVLRNYFIISVIVALIGIEVLRLIIGKSNANDSWLLFRDVAPNFFAVFPLNFLFWLVLKENKPQKILLLPVYLTFGLIIYEFIQKVLPFQTFDSRDIFASCISMVICVIVNYVILKLAKDH